MPKESARNTRNNATENTLENTLDEIKEQLDNMSKRMVKIEDKVTTQGKIMKKLEEVIEQNKELANDMQEMKQSNDKLKERIKSLEKEAEAKINRERRKQIEIIGIPYKADERAQDIMIRLALTAKVEIEAKDIDKTFRLKPRPNGESTIIVEFKDVRKRDITIKELKKIKPRLEMLNMEPKNKNIYINESISARAKNILYRVKKEAYERKWYRVWTYSGVVYLKMEKEGRQIKIETEEEMETLLK